MAKKPTKAAQVLELLNKGWSAKKITNAMAVSASYISKLKKEMAHKADDDNEVRARTVAPHKMMRVTKSQAEDIKELSYQLTRGRQAREADKIKEAIESWNDEPEIDEVLTARHNNYGTFYDLARLAQEFKNITHLHLIHANKHLEADQHEALEFIFTKIARIINGNADNVDSWVDIAGYAKLVADRLQGQVR